MIQSSGAILTLLSMILLAGCQYGSYLTPIPDLYTSIPSPLALSVTPESSQEPDWSATRVLTVVPIETVPGMMTLTSDQLTAQTIEFRDNSLITLEENGQTFTFTQASRFHVYLNDQTHPVSELDCKPKWLMGLVTNGLFRGGEMYPMYYETVWPGRCTLSNRDFSVEIVVLEDVTPAPTP